MTKYEAPKGTRDFPPGEMDLRKGVFDVIETGFRLYNFKPWDAPAFENIETLQRKAGEAIGDEIYTFKDKGDRTMGLRFELTTSLARIMANSSHLRFPVKAYSIGKVWRYERPQQGRYREFYQCDADIFGSNDISSEVELLMLSKYVLSNLGFEDFQVRLNNRKILLAQTTLAEIPADKTEASLRSLDKLAKIGPDGVRSEFLRSGLTDAQFTRFMETIPQIGTNADKLTNLSSQFSNSPIGMQGVVELEQILSLLGKTGLSDKVAVDCSLVRGLSYYTGPIFEIAIQSGKEVGSISGGGRYDGLVEVFGGKPTPAVGISFGIERIVDLIHASELLKSHIKIDHPVVQVVYDPACYAEALATVSTLRDNGIKTEYDLGRRNFSKQFKIANQNAVAYAFILGPEEINSGVVSVKDMATGEQKKLPFNVILETLKRHEKL